MSDLSLIAAQVHTCSLYLVQRGNHDKRYRSRKTIELSEHNDVTEEGMFLSFSSTTHPSLSIQYPHIILLFSIQCMSALFLPTFLYFLGYFSHFRCPSNCFDTFTDCYWISSMELRVSSEVSCENNHFKLALTMTHGTLIQPYPVNKHVFSATN